MRRTILAMIAIFSTALLAFTVAPADARGVADRHGTVASSVTSAERVLPPHDVRRLRAFEIRDTGRFRVKGKAITYLRKPVVLKKANRKAGPYHFVGQDRTDAAGRFSITFRGRIGTHFKIFLKKTPHYRATSFYIGKIVRD